MHRPAWFSSPNTAKQASRYPNSSLGVGVARVDDLVALAGLGEPRDEHAGHGRGGPHSVVGLLRINSTVTQHWSVQIPAEALYGGIGAALVIGAIAGLYPSMRATRLSPTEALRTV